MTKAARNEEATRWSAILDDAELLARLHVCARGCAHDTSIADDLVQSAVAAALSAGPPNRVENHEAYLKKCVRSAASKARIRCQRQLDVAAMTWRERGCGCYAEPADFEVEQRDEFVLRGNLLGSRLHLLGDKQRLYVEDRRRGLCNAEIAEKHGVTPDTVRGMLRDAWKRISGCSNDLW